MDIRYLIFDIESVADSDLVAKIRFPEETFGDAREAVRKYRDELLVKNDSDFIPYTYQLPISLAVAKVKADFTLVDLVALDEPHFRPHEICKKFWAGWEAYNHPTLVSFNGRGFDVPLLELAAFRYGISVPNWFAMAGNFKSPRNRYNTQSHLDLCDVLTNFGASRFHGGLNLAANILGKPGKMDVQGNMVQDLYEAGDLEKINDYCRCDVLDTYFLFLRIMVLFGQLNLETEQNLVRHTKTWLQERGTHPAYSLYLEKWGDWPNPWTPAS